MQKPYSMSVDWKARWFSFDKKTSCITATSDDVVTISNGHTCIASDFQTILWSCNEQYKSEALHAGNA